MAYIGYYPFNSGLIDEGTLTNDLTEVGGVVAFEDAPFMEIALATKQARMFPGVHLDTGYQLTSGQLFSFTMWVRIDPASPSGLLFGQHDGSDGLAVEWIADTEVAQLKINGVTSTSTPMPSGVICPITVAYKDGDVDFYINGKRELDSVPETAVMPVQNLIFGGETIMDVVEVSIHDSAVDGIGANGLAQKPSSPTPVPLEQAPSSFSPVSMEGLSLWIDPSDLDTVTESGGTITSIADKSPTGLTADDAGTGTLPLQTLAWQNNLAALYLNGGSGMSLLWDSTGSELQNTRTVFIMYEWVDGGSDYDHLFANIGAFHGDTAASGKVFSGGYGSLIGYNAAARVNGASVGAGSAVTRVQAPHILSLEFQTFNDDFWGVGNPDGTGFPARAPHVRIGEVLAFNRVLTAAETESVEGYLAWKWATDADLDAGHPYKAAPPNPNLDPYYFPYVSLLLPFDEVDQSTAATDYSAQEHVPNFYGNAKISTVFGGPNGRAGSLELDGAGDYLDITHDNTTLDVTGGDYTVECHVLFNLIAVEYAFLTHQYSTTNIPFGIGIGNTTIPANVQNTMMWAGFYNTSGGWEGIATQWTPNTGQWYHVALVIKGSIMRFFVDGVQQGSDHTIINTPGSTTLPVRIGQRWDANGGQYHNGGMANVRLTKGWARYDANFQPPTLDYPRSLPPEGDQYWQQAPLILPIEDTPNEALIYQGDDAVAITVQTNAAVWNDAYSINGTSLANFGEAVSSYLDLVAASAITISGDFTVEYFVRLNNIRSCHIDMFSDNLTTRTLSIYNWDWGGGTMNATLIADGGGGWAGNSAAVLSLPQMTHVAMVRSGGVITLYWDGIARGTTYTGSTTPLIIKTIRVGQGFPGAARGLNGYIDGLRISSVARYTADFAPPATMFPLGPVTEGDYNRINQLGPQFMINSFGRAADAESLSPGYGFWNGDQVHDSFGWLEDQSKVFTDAYHLGVYTDPRTRQPNIKEPTGFLSMDKGVMDGSFNHADRRKAGFLEGTVTNEFSVPLSRKVRLYDRHTGLLVDERWADPAGYYRFEGLSLRLRYTLVAVDYTDAYNAVIADNATPEAY